MVVNRSTSNVQLLIPAPVGSNRSAVALTVGPSNAINILPYAGSISACRSIGQLSYYEAKGIIEIIEE